MALDIELRGHALRYAAEQAVMAFLPEFGPGDRLISALAGTAAEADLTYRGRHCRGLAALAELCLPMTSCASGRSSAW